MVENSCSIFQPWLCRIVGSALVVRNFTAKRWVAAGGAAFTVTLLSAAAWGVKSGAKLKSPVARTKTIMANRFAENRGGLNDIYKSIDVLGYK